MKGNAKNYSGNDSRNYSKTKEYDLESAVGVGSLAAIGAGVGMMLACGDGVKTTNYALRNAGIVTVGAGSVGGLGILTYDVLAGGNQSPSQRKYADRTRHLQSMSDLRIVSDPVGPCPWPEAKPEVRKK